MPTRPAALTAPPNDARSQAFAAKNANEPARAAAPGRRRVEVPLGERAYPILIGPGLIDEAGAQIARLAPGVNCAIVTDSHLAPLYLDRLTASLREAGLGSTSIVCPHSEHRA